MEDNAMVQPAEESSDDETEVFYQLLFTDI
jgi:hypothetical protein